eukprot:337000-Chlamydomonas_euryale.AAC.2
MSAPAATDSAQNVRNRYDALFGAAVKRKREGDRGAGCSIRLPGLCRLGRLCCLAGCDACAGCAAVRVFRGVTEHGVDVWAAAVKEARTRKLLPQPWLERAVQCGDQWVSKTAVHGVGGAWNGGAWNGGAWNEGAWNGGAWERGAWHGGAWHGGAWHGGAWNGGAWERGAWHGGAWHGGAWHGGAWSGGA